MLNDTLEQYILDQGADQVGFADLSDVDLSLTEGFSRGIAILVALDADIVRNIESGPNMAYYDTYKQVNSQLDRIALQTVAYIKSLGYKAHTNPSTIKAVRADNRTHYLPHKTVATKSGLGWIGKSALLVTQKFGSAVRLSAVYTDAPIKPAKPIIKSSCGVCTNCLRACPAGAIKGPNWEAGIERAQIYDADLCKWQAKESSQAVGIDNTICGICINVCPYTRRYLRSKLGVAYDV